MAFNDMNSWDEDPDELLRQRWQRTFADFEVQPRSSLSRLILNPLRARRYRRRAFWLAVGLLFLLGVGFVYQLCFREGSDRAPTSILLDRHARSTEPLTDRPVHQPTVPIGRPTRPERSTTALPTQESVTYPLSATRPSTAPGTEPTFRKSIQVNVIGTEAPAGWHRSMERAHRRTKAGKTLIVMPVFVVKSHASLPRARSTRPAVQSADLFGTVSPTLQSIPVEQPVNHPLSDSQSFGRAAPLRWAQIKPTGILLLPSQLSALPDSISTLDRVARPAAKSTSPQPGWHWFVEGAPLSSFQRMSAPPVSSLHLSQVEAPAAFSPATWGYQLNGGIRFQRWQAYLAIGKMRRWAYYTVNENRYRVESGTTNTQLLVRETYKVIENIALPMLGAGLSQTHHLGRFEMEFGGSLSYLPTNSQALIGLRGGVSRKVLLNQRMELQIGLRGEYGLNRLLDEKGQLAIHPLLVGVGFRLQPCFGPLQFGTRR